jgi:UDP-N-acetylmuramyl pentapeptide phosphotransferase/UDP-N-acetylglucosamine-1-phosphate transferase
MDNTKKRMRVGLGETHVGAQHTRDGDTTPNPRFWIISMMLVLIGLSTLKLR